MPSKRRQHDANRGDELLEAALGYAEKDIPVIPLHSINGRGKCDCARSDCDSPGKHPRWHKDDLPEGFKNATTDNAQIEKWWARWPEANIAGVMGDPYVAIDVDVSGGKKGEESLRELEAEYGEFPKTAASRTGKYKGRRGRHYFFTTEGGIGSEQKLLKRFEHIDLRGDDGYVVLPPSHHKTGVDYEWEVPLSKAVAMPEALEEALLDSGDHGEAAEPDPDWEPDGTPISAEVRGLLRDGDWPMGEQRSILQKCARSVIRSKRGWDRLAEEQGEIVASLLDALERSDQNPEKPWTERDVERLVVDFIAHPPEPTRQDRRKKIELSLTDAGNADRFARRFRDDARFVPEWDSWVFWVGDRWEKDAAILAVQRMLEVAREIPKEANDLGDLGDEETLKLAKRIFNWAERSLTAQRVRAAVELARAHPDLIARPTEFDSDLNLLNCRNGTLDLRSGDLRPHDRADMLTQQVRCDFDPDAVSGDWERVLHDAFNGDEALIAYLRRVFGYSLTGDTTEEKFFFLYGKSGAGKGTILDSFGGMLGDYQRTMNARSLTKSAQQSGSSASEDIARLAGGRFAVANEFDAGDRFAAALVNTLTGKDKINARFLNRNSFEFYPQVKIFVAANDLPRQSSSPESGVWRRIQVVPFDHRVEKIDKKLKGRLEEDEARAAILAWAVRGCLEWQREGLGDAPAQVVEAVEEYREQSDPVHRVFIEEKIEASPGNFIPNGVMWDTYRAWATKKEIRNPITQGTLTQVLKERGVEQGKKYLTIDGKRTSIRIWKDVRVRGISDDQQRSYQGAR